MQGFQTHTAIQPISIQPLQTQQKPCVAEARHSAEKHSLLRVSVCPQGGGVHPLGRHPPRQTPPGRHPLGRHPQADDHCSGRCTSYWNAFSSTRMHSIGMRTVCCSGHLGRGCLPAWGVSARVGCLLSARNSHPPPWTEFLTHACENITFPQLLLRTVMNARNNH